MTSNKKITRYAKKHEINSNRPPNDTHDEISRPRCLNSHHTYAPENQKSRGKCKYDVERNGIYKSKPNETSRDYKQNI